MNNRLKDALIYCGAWKTPSPRMFEIDLIKHMNNVIHAIKRNVPE